MTRQEPRNLSAGDVVNERSLRQRAEAEIQHLRHGIEATTGRPVPVVLIGALKTGLFSGPKEKRYSHNSACPYEQVLEVDLRVIDPAAPHSREWVDTVSERFHPSEVVRKHSIHWNQHSVRQTTMYRYENASDVVDVADGLDVGIEFELCLNQTPYVEISLYWDRLFTPAEIDEQRRLRDRLRSSMVPLPVYHQFKRSQILEAQWRLLAAISLEAVADDTTECPRLGTLGEPVATLAQHWSTGARRDPPLARACRTNPWINFAGSLPLPASNDNTPTWVTFADQCQQRASSTGRDPNR